MDRNQQKEFEKQMKRLKEDKIFPPMKRSIVKGTRYLIISLGGTGADALFGIKKKFEEIIPEDQYEDCVRLLAIDTCSDTKQCTKKVVDEDGSEQVEVIDTLSDQQFFFLSGAAARNVVTHSVGMVDDWINPDLPAMIKNDQDLLTGTGASAIRQIGRVTLFPQNTVESLQGRISYLVSQLTDTTADKLKVMIVAGIAGGTGSGTVIDISYLIRHFIENMPGSISKRTQYAGFILLPPTGRSTNATDIKKGNQNGYAALKEINQFMTLAEREEMYSHKYAGITVKSDKNIFDVCYLMDGVAHGVSMGSNARDFVVNVVAECMVDMLTSQPVDGSAPQTVDAFMNDASTYASAMVRSKSENDAPRDADYRYCAIGHCEAEIPVALMKAYVAQKVFEKMYNVFKKCDRVEADDVRAFVKGVTMPDSKVSEQAIKRAVDQSVEVMFKSFNNFKGGPFYVNNLLCHVPEITEEFKKQMKLFRPNSASKEQLDAIAAYSIRLNHDTYDVYTAVMEGMRNIIAKEADIEAYSEFTENSYSFCPINVSDASGAVRKYLDGLVSGKRVEKLTNEMLEEMIKNRNEWTQIFMKDKVLGEMNLPKVIRKFWNEKLNAFIGSTIEDFLIKYYSGDPQACYDSDDPESSEDALERAAKELYDQMFGVAGKAHPMADFTNVGGLSESDFNGHNIILVPEQAPHLMKKIKEVAAARASVGNQVAVYSSFANDRISSYAQYTGIPAFKLNWVCRAESDYEEALAGAKQGLHMSESNKGRLWREFPNLIPESAWKLSPKQDYYNRREKVLADMAHNLFKEAKSLGLTKSVPIAAGANFEEYTVEILPKELRPDEQAYKEFDLASEDSRVKDDKAAEIDRKAEECAQKLFEILESKIASGADMQYLDKALEECDSPVSFALKKLKTSQTVLTSNPNTEKPAGWDEYIAGCMLRKMPDTMSALRGTVAVFKKLRTKVDAAIQGMGAKLLFARYLTVGLFNYNADYYQWEYIAADGSDEVLVELEPEDKIQKTAEYYFMYEAVKKLDADQLEGLSTHYDEMTAYDGKAEQIEKKLSLKAKAKELGEEVEKRFADKTNPDKLTVIGSTEYAKKAEAKGYDVKAIRAFYKELAEQLEDLTFELKDRKSL